MKKSFSKATLLIVICFSSCGRSPNETPRNAAPNTNVSGNSAEDKRAKPDYPTAVVTEGDWQVPGLTDSTIIERSDLSEVGMSEVPEEFRRSPKLQPPKPDPIYVTWYKLNVPEYVIEDTFFTQEQWRIVRKALDAPSGRLAVIEISKYDKGESFSYVVHVQVVGRKYHTHPYSLHFYGRGFDGKIEGVEGVPFNFVPKVPGVKA